MMKCATNSTHHEFTGEFPMSNITRLHPLRLLLLVLLLAGCTPAPESSVLGYLLARWLGTSGPAPITATGNIAHPVG